MEIQKEYTYGTYISKAEFLQTSVYILYKFIKYCIALYCIVLYCIVCYAILLLERISHLHKLNAHEIVTQQTAKSYVRQPGIEPGSTAWEAAIITLIPLPLQQFGCYIYIYKQFSVLKMTHRQIFL